MGLDANNEKKDSYEPGIELHAKTTVFAEGCRGHLGKQLIKKFDLAKNSDPQQYGIGLKELWSVSPEKHVPGKVIHAIGWPLGLMPGEATGGTFLYHLPDNQVSLGLIADLSYSNPHLSPI